MSFSSEKQEYFMRVAMEQAQAAIERGDSPFGAVLVTPQGDVMATDSNTAYTSNDMTAHAEINLIRQVQKEYGRDALAGQALIVNAASCAMCASAVIRAGVREVYYGAPFEPHTNPAITYEGLEPHCRNPIRVIGGILADECMTQIEQGRHRQANKGIRYSK
jgi:tRNA(adenine34) deaminase